MPCTPGSDGAVTDEKPLKPRERSGLPVLVKAASGGGGRGMKVVEKEEDLVNLVAEAPGVITAFGDDTVYMEKYLSRPRHIEVQVIADSHGNVVHLGERIVPCNDVTRRYWKNAHPRHLTAKPVTNWVRFAPMLSGNLATLASEP